MNSQMHSILKLSNFFSVLEISDITAKYILKAPSQILLQNIRTNWLQTIYSKTCKHYPVYLNDESTKIAQDVPFGIIKSGIPQSEKQLDHQLDDFAPKTRSKLNFILKIPKQEFMPYFIQWQRLRKYWWSSITTTPSLFGIDDIKYNHNTADVNIIAKFPSEQKIVETINIKETNNEMCLTCASNLEGALIIVLLDALNNTRNEEYLRFHRTMAPYKISFALNVEDSSRKNDLRDLAEVIYQKLVTKKISALLPDFTSTLPDQIKHNLKMGVIYTAILSENTLSNGIIHLMNSNTMLKEQVHIADFDSYASLIFA